MCYAFVDATVRCVASAAICFQPFLAAMSSVHVAMLVASWVCPGLALFLEWLGRGPLKNHEFKSSGFSGFATDCETVACSSLLVSLELRLTLRVLCSL